MHGIPSVMIKFSKCRGKITSTGNYNLNLEKFHVLSSFTKFVFTCEQEIRI
jgi:hypothetical protein